MAEAAVRGDNPGDTAYIVKLIYRCSVIEVGFLGSVIYTVFKVKTSRRIVCRGIIFNIRLYI